MNSLHTRLAGRLSVILSEGEVLRHLGLRRRWSPKLSRRPLSIGVGESLSYAIAQFVGSTARGKKEGGVN